MVQTDELLRTKKKQTYIMSPTSREKEDFYRRLFFTDKEKFQVFWKVTILALSRLKSDSIQMVQADELLRTKKKQTYLISPTSVEIEDSLEKTFFY